MGAKAQPRRYNRKDAFKYGKRPDLDIEKYREWRKAVLKRDGYKCQMPDCKKTRGLQIHHIIRWSDNPGLRYEINNGITLCFNCHKGIHGKEQLYASLFIKILRDKK